jgi:signal transduction histidine kinase/ActR/RegA family two-component response regulator
MRVVMTTTLVALMLSSALLLVYELNTHRRSWLQDLQTQTELVAQACLPALAFDDPRVARENLALLRLRPQIEAAALYDETGRQFAAYAAAGQGGLPLRADGAGAGHEFDRDRLELRHSIFQQDERLGTLIVRAHYDVLPRLLDYLGILALVILSSFGLAALVAGRLQRGVTDPIVAVSNTAREVVLQRDYALRAAKTTDDEVGTLVDAFNDMLRELGGQSDALQAADRRKDEFLATLAHELRNPLAPVSTALAILQRGDSDAATQARLVTMMQRQMGQFTRLIDDLMEVSRVSTGRLRLSVEQLDLVELVHAAVESAAPSLLERRHTLVVSWPDPVWVEGDHTRLGQVFANLLGNATKYTEAGGRIEIAFDVQPDQVAVCIADNGIGIAPEMQQEVFDMFVQVDRTLTRRAGLGVGLSLARQLVLLHKGSLSLHSAGLGRGSRFTVTLPRLPGPSPAPTPVPATSVGFQGVPWRSLSILLADDNRDFVDSLASVLVSAGHRVQVAYDGTMAMHLVSVATPDVGLFDIGMPLVDGYTLAAMVRRQPRGKDCLLVAVTGWGQQADRSRARDAGFDEHLVKPVNLDALLQLLSARAAEPAAHAES